MGQQYDWYNKTVLAVDVLAVRKIKRLILVSAKLKMASSFAQSPSKRQGEKFFLLYSLAWIATLMFVVVTKAYESFGPSQYLHFAVAIATPALILPILFPSKVDELQSIGSRYCLKVNVFIAILTVTGNYFYTHYFYTVLGVRYTGPLTPGRGVDLNGVPLSMYFMTHAYFCFYHILAGIVLRTTRRACRHVTSDPIIEFLAVGSVVVGFSWAVAFLETWTISGFPYYTYPDQMRMYTHGSTFYALFFIISFPMFSRMDEVSAKPWGLGRVVVEAMATMMLILWVADLWRLFVVSDSSVVIPPSNFG